MQSPSDHLLRTLGAVPASSRVLDLGCGTGQHTEPLARLGFDVYACDTSPEAVARVRSTMSEILDDEAEAQKRCIVSKLDALGFGDDVFDWVVAFDALRRAETREDVIETLREARRVLKEGGWIYVAVPAVSAEDMLEPSRGYAGDSGLTPAFTPRTLDEVAFEAGFTTAVAPSVSTESDRRLVQGIYRNVESGTRD